MKKILTILMIFISSLSIAKNLENAIYTNQAGKEVKISDFKGKTYMKVWASWCHVCLATMDHTVELSKDKNIDFNVIAVVAPSFNGEKNKESFIKWYKNTKWSDFDTLMDEKGVTIRKLRIRAYPTNVFIDSNGEVVKIRLGAMDAEQIKAIMKNIK